MQANVLGDLSIVPREVFNIVANGRRVREHNRMHAWFGMVSRRRGAIPNGKRGCTRWIEEERWKRGYSGDRWNWCGRNKKVSLQGHAPPVSLKFRCHPPTHPSTHLCYLTSHPSCRLIDTDFPVATFSVFTTGLPPLVHGGAGREAGVKGVPKP